MNELEYTPELAEYLHIIPDVLPGVVMLVPRAQCDDLVLVKHVARVYGGDIPQIGTGKAGNTAAA